jgi:hypothetical protein
MVAARPAMASRLEIGSPPTGIAGQPDQEHHAARRSECWASGLGVTSARGRPGFRPGGIAGAAWNPGERVIGSGTTLGYRPGDLYRTKGVGQPIDNGPGQPVHIWAPHGR